MVETTNELILSKLKSIETGQQEMKEELSTAVQYISNKIDQRISVVTEKIGELDSTLDLLEKQAQYREDRDRRDNLIFLGFPKIQNETWKLLEEEIIGFIDHFMQIKLDTRDIIRAHRISPYKSNSPIIVRFSHFKTKELILRNKNMIKKTSYVIFEDFSLATREERKILNQFAAKIREEEGDNVRTRLSYRTLRVNDAVYQVENGKVKKMNSRQPAGVNNIKSNNFSAGCNQSFSQAQSTGNTFSQSWSKNETEKRNRKRNTVISPGTVAENKLQNKSRKEVYNNIESDRESDISMPENDNNSSSGRRWSVDGGANLSQNSIRLIRDKSE